MSYINGLTISYTKNNTNNLPSRAFVKLWLLFVVVVVVLR